MIKVPKKIWEFVKDIEEHEQNHISDIGECKATLVINYGELGRCRPGLLKKETGRLMPMLVDVLEWYEKELQEYESTTLKFK